MAGSSHAMLERQVRKVRRRMFIQAAVNGLIVACVAACGVLAGWLLAKPHFLGDSVRPWMDWAVGGAAFAISTLGAMIWAYRSTPAPVEAALSLDERFQLRERVTTSLTLSDEQRASPAGEALLSDAQAKIAGLDVGSRFPVRFGWKSVLVPVAIAAVALLAIFYEPAINSAQGNTPPASPLTPEQAREIEQKKQEYLQKPKAETKQPNRIKNADLEKIEAKLQEILKKPMTTQDEVKDRLAEISSLEEQVKKKEKEEAEKVEGFKDQLKKLDQLSKKEKPKSGEENGPSKDLRDALKDGDMKKAKEEADRLGKKLKNDELTKKEKDHLEQEMKDLKNDLERLKRDREKELEDKRKENEEKRQEKEKQLEQQKNEGKLDKEQYEQEKKKLEEERKQEEKELKEQKQELDQLQKKMEKCEQCMKNGDKEGAAEALREAADQLEKQSQKEQQLDDLENELQRMQDLREGMAKACENGGREGQDDDAETLSRRKDDEGKNGGKGSGKGGKGKGRRPERKNGDSKSIDAKQNAPFDKKGAKIHVGTAGQAEKVIGKASVSIQGEIKQASQDAPEAVETQRIPRGYKDSTKGYFKNIGGQKTGENVPMPPK
jgi:hypothetical protein